MLQQGFAYCHPAIDRRMSRCHGPSNIRPRSGLIGKLYVLLRNPPLYTRSLLAVIIVCSSDNSFVRLLPHRRYSLPTAYNAPKVHRQDASYSCPPRCGGCRFGQPCPSRCNLSYITLWISSSRLLWYLSGIIRDHCRQCYEVEA